MLPVAVIPSAAAVSLQCNSARIGCVWHLLRLSAPPGWSLSEGAGLLLIEGVLGLFTLPAKGAVFSRTDAEVLDTSLLSAALRSTNSVVCQISWRSSKFAMIERIPRRSGNTRLSGHDYILTLSKGSRSQLISERFSRMMSARRSMSA